MDCCDRSASRSLDIGIRCLDAFVGSNFAGITTLDEDAEISALLHSSESTDALRNLSFDFNTPFSEARNLELLWLAKECLETEFDDKDQSNFDRFRHLLWRFRVYQIWAKVLTEKSLELKRKIDATLSEIDSLVESSDLSEFCRNILFQYYLERSILKVDFFEINEAKQALAKAAEMSHLDVKLDGALGKRTRFQQKSVAQLIVSTNITSDITLSDVSDGVHLSSDVPINCKNSDDTLLEEVKLDDNDAAGCRDIQQLSEEQLAYVLALGVQRHSAIMELETETLMAFVEEVIRHRRNWSIQLRALIERSELERQNKRRVERACSQMDSIAKLLDGFDHVKLSRDELSKRLRLIYSTSPLPFWSVKKILAKILISLGCISEALRIYETLKTWDEVIQCYKSLNQMEKAEHIVRDLLATQPKNPIYHCVLGDITNNADHFYEAIKVTDNRCARASSSLGRLYLCRKQYDTALKHFKRSVELQPYQIRVWFNLGHCAMKVEDYQEGVRAYHRCVSFESEHFEAWNNLAACYVNLGQKERAQKVLKESLKLNHENSNVWQNLILISVDINDFKAAISAFKSLLDLDAKRKVDELPLEITVAKVLQLPDDDESAEGWRVSLAEILARVVARQSVGATLWKLYAELKKPAENSTDKIAWSKYIQLLEKAVQQQSNAAPSDKMTEEHYARKLNDTMELIDAMRPLWKLQELMENQINTQIKLRISPIIGSIERSIGADPSNFTNEDLRSSFTKAKKMFT